MNRSQGGETGRFKTSNQYLSKKRYQEIARSINKDDFEFAKDSTSSSSSSEDDENSSSSSSSEDKEDVVKYLNTTTKTLLVPRKSPFNNTLALQKPVS